MSEIDKANVLENLTTAVMITNKDMNILYANTAAEQLCGISRNRLQTQKLSDLVDREEITLIDTLNNPDFNINFQGFSAADVRFSPYPGKSSKADLTIFQYSDSKFDGFLVEIHPIAHQEKLINQAQQNFQFNAARDLIRNLAHEIKNPLGGIRGAAQLIEMTYANKVENLKEYTKVIIEQCDRLKVLVNNLLGPQRPNPLTEVNIHYLLEKVLKLVQMQDNSKRIRFERDYDPSLPELALDSDSIEQVFLNIINNAIDALDNEVFKDPFIRISTRASFRTIIRETKYPLCMVISISNNGPQISEQLKKTLFYPMVTTKPNGNGLGLSLALNIIERHNGTIECLSDAHETAFRIILPVKTENHGEYR